MSDNRYARQINCAAGFEQRKLHDSTVLIVGVGGLGCTASMTLAAAGVGSLQLCDHDTVSISNLNRQLLYTESDLGKGKAVVAAEKLKGLNPDTQCIPIASRFSAQSVEEFSRPDLILDCLDNMEARKELIAYAAQQGIPLVHAAIHGFAGQFSFFIPNQTACPFCVVSGDLDSGNAVIPSIGPCVTALASFQAVEAVKHLSGVGETCAGKMMFFDLLTNSVETLNIETDPACTACGKVQGGE